MYTSKLCAQTDDLMNLAMQHFGSENQTGAWWLKDFSGYLDYVHPVRMVVATNNEIYKGAYELKNSGLKFYIDGQLEGNEIHFVETDLNGRVTGYITGELNENKFYCTWSDVRNIEKMNLNVFENTASTICENHLGWIEYYEPLDAKSEVKSYTIQNKEGTYTLFYSDKSIVMECNDETCSTLSSLSAFGDNEAEILFDRVHKSISFDPENKVASHLNLLNKMAFEANTFIDFDEKISVIYPISKNVKFSNWSSTFFTNLFNKETFEFVKKTNNDALSDRFTNVYIGDVFIDILSDSMISGLFTIQSSNFNPVIEQTFLYDLKKNRKVEVEDVLLVNDEFKKILIDKASKLESERPNEEKQLIHYTFTESGLKCRTAFSTLYGRESAVIPYAELKPFILKKGMLSRYGNK